MERLIEIKEKISKITEGCKSLYLSNNEIEWLVINVEYYEKLFGNYYKSNIELNRQVRHLQNEISLHIQFLDKVHKGWEDKWNFETLLEENKELKEKLGLLENVKEELIYSVWEEDHEENQ